LHPRYKTIYFQRQKWPDFWIDTSVSLARKQWEKSYKQASGEKISKPETENSGYFAELDTFEVLEGTDELDGYLGLPAQPLVTDPLQHWEAQQVSGSHLAQMALDFLSMPG
ncbi:hypothetical protein K439DRAFT_1313397, partial [Ramaria rubella]